MYSKHFFILISILSMLKCHSHNVELYKHLDLNYDATDEQIKKSYQELTKKYHPDKGGNQSKYVKIQRAYEILSNRIKKSIYDTDGMDEVSRYEHALENGYVDRRYNKMRPKKVTLSITLKEAFLGAERNIAISRKSLCRACHATGAKHGEFKVCPHCNGEGMTIQTIRTGMGIMRMQSQCEHCGGRGKFAKATCPVCGGRKSIQENKNFKIDIERGINDGDQITFEGEGDAIEQALPGDVVITIKVKEDSRFQRQGDDLYSKMKIEFKEAIFGFDRTLTHLDGRRIQVQKTGISQPNELIKIEGEGMNKSNGEKGHMFVEIVFDLPSKISLKQKKIVREIFKIEQN